MLSQVVQEALNAQPVEDRDAATAELALTYARDIDAGGDLAKLGPALLACLESLGMSPRARKAVKASEQPAANPLDQLAAARARRGRPQAVDAATS